jgi:hypothetical protein
VQAEKLHDNKEQEDNAAKAGVQEVLPLLQDPYSSQRNEIG